MCGRVIQASGPLSLAIVDGLDVRDSRLTNIPRRFNAAPSQELLVIRQNHKTGERSLDLLRWGQSRTGAEFTPSASEFACSDEERVCLRHSESENGRRT